MHLRGPQALLYLPRDRSTAPPNPLDADAAAFLFTSTQRYKHYAEKRRRSGT